MNKIMLVGKIEEMKNDKDNNTYIKLDVSNSDYAEWDIKVIKEVGDSVNEYCSVGMMIGVLGTLINENGNMLVKSEKVSFLTSNKDILNENER